MDGLKWVQIDSWHIVKTAFESRGGIEMETTLCGLRTSGATHDERKGNEATCENCLRILTKD